MIRTFRGLTRTRYLATTAVAITLGGNWRITEQQAWSLKSIWG